TPVLRFDRADGAGHQLLEHRRFHIRHRADVETPLAYLVSAELLEQAVLVGKVTRQVHGDVALSRGESDDTRVPLAAALVLVVIAAEADDAGPPHLWLLLRHL